MKTTGDFMKRLFLILIFCLFAFSISAKEPTLNESGYGSICIEGYKFAWFKSGGQNGVSLVQIYVQGGNLRLPPQPMRCK